MADQKNYPSNIEEFVSSVWYKRIHTLVSKYRLSETVEDVVSDIILAMIQKDYLSLYSETKGSFSNWIYTFSNNVCRKKYNRSNSRGGKAVEMAKSFVDSPKNEDDFFKGFYFDSFTEDASTSAEVNLLCEEIENILNRHPACSSNVFDAVEYKRDMGTVYKLTLSGFSPSEIAERFGTSVSFVYSLIKKIRIISSQVAFSY